MKAFTCTVTVTIDDPKEAAVAQRLEEFCKTNM